MKPEDAQVLESIKVRGDTARVQGLVDALVGAGCGRDPRDTPAYLIDTRSIPSSFRRGPPVEDLMGP